MAMGYYYCAPHYYKVEVANQGLEVPKLGGVIDIPEGHRVLDTFDNETGRRMRVVPHSLDRLDILAPTGPKRMLVTKL